MSRWCDQSIHDAGHSESPHGPLLGRENVWNSRRGNHLGQRSCASATTGRTYGRKRSDQNAAIHLARKGPSTYGRKRSDQSTAKTPCKEGAVHICLQVTLKQRLRSLAPGLTPRSVLDKMAVIQMVDVHLPTTDGRTVILSRYTEPEMDQAILLQRLKISLPAQPPPRVAAGDVP
jgi:hypothetical protein